MKEKISNKNRLFEMFERVSKIKLNEDNSTSIVNYTFDELKNGELYITNSNTQTNDNETYVSLNCTNKNKDKIKLTFKVDLSGQSTDGVSEVSEILLTGFEFNSSNNQTTFNLKDAELDEFNNERKEEFFDVIQEYIDVETDSIAQDELYEEAIRNIDKYSYEGGTERMQTSKNYGDNKPTNPNLRVKSPETDKFIQEDLEQAANTITSKLDGKKKQILLDTIKTIKQSKGNGYKPTASEVHQEINKSKSVGNGHSVVSENNEIDSFDLDNLYKK